MPQALSPVAWDRLKAGDPCKRSLSSLPCSLMPGLVQGTPSLPHPAPQPPKEGVFWAQVPWDRRGQSSPRDGPQGKGQHVLPIPCSPGREEHGRNLRSSNVLNRSPDVWHVYVCKTKGEMIKSSVLGNEKAKGSEFFGFIFPGSLSRTRALVCRIALARRHRLLLFSGDSHAELPVAMGLYFRFRNSC